jgi:hypothetical protein
MENKLFFDEVELNYILEAVQFLAEQKASGGDPHRAVYTAELENIEERILHYRVLLAVRRANPSQISQIKKILEG